MHESSRLAAVLERIEHSSEGKKRCCCGGGLQGREGPGGIQQGISLDDERMMAAASQCHVTLHIAISKHMSFMKRWRLAIAHHRLCLLF